MKKLILLSLIALSLSGMAQSKKDNLITISHDNGKTELFKLTKLALIETGYDLDKSDSDIFYIKTAAKEYSRGYMRLTITIIDNALKLRGDLSIGTLHLYGVESDTWGRIEFRGMKGSPFREAWEAMANFASIIAEQIGGDIKYSRQ